MGYYQVFKFAIFIGFVMYSRVNQIAIWVSHLRPFDLIIYIVVCETLALRHKVQGQEKGTDQGFFNGRRRF